MAWEVPSNERGGADSAFDGDGDIAFALVLADAQWSSAGALNYAEGARRTIAGILASTIGPESRLPMLGDWTEPGGAPYNEYTPQTSDFMLDHFRAFGRFTRDPAWDVVISRSQSVVSQLQPRFAPGTGLLPDFAVPVSREDHSPRPAPAEFLEGPVYGRHEDYYEDSLTLLSLLVMTGNYWDPTAR